MDPTSYIGFWLMIGILGILYLLILRNKISEWSYKRKVKKEKKIEKLLRIETKK